MDCGIQDYMKHWSKRWQCHTVGIALHSPEVVHAVVTWCWRMFLYFLQYQVTAIPWSQLTVICIFHKREGINPSETSPKHGTATANSASTHYTILSCPRVSGRCVLSEPSCISNDSANVFNQHGHRKHRPAHRPRC